MKPRTVLLTLELPNCTTSLTNLRRIRHIEGFAVRMSHCDALTASPIVVLDVAQAQASVAQPSGKRGK